MNETYFIHTRVTYPEENGEKKSFRAFETLAWRAPFTNHVYNGVPMINEKINVITFLDSQQLASLSDKICV